MPDGPRRKAAKALLLKHLGRFPSSAEVTQFLKDNELPPRAPVGPPGAPVGNPRGEPLRTEPPVFTLVPADPPVWENPEPKTPATAPPSPPPRKIRAGVRRVGQ